MCLLNVNEYEHYVEQCKEDRIIFSILFVDKDFKTIKDIIKWNWRKHISILAVQTTYKCNMLCVIVILVIC